MAVTVKDLEKIRQEGLKALREKLGPIGMIKFIQIQMRYQKIMA